MPPSSSRTNRTLLLLAIVLVGLVLLLLMGKSRRGPDGSQMKQAHLKSSGDVSFGNEENGGKHTEKKQRPVIDKRARSLAIGKCAQRVEARLKEDEATRAKLLSKSETNDAFSYSFAISPRADMQTYINQLITEEAVRANLDPAAILHDISFETALPQSFKFSDGYMLHVQIVVPKDPAKRPNGSAVEVTPENIQAVERKDAVIGEKNMFFIQVQPQEKNWRFDHLLQLDGVAQK